MMDIGIDYVGISTPFYCNDGKGHFLLHKRSVNTRDKHGRWDPGSGKLEFGMQLEENVLKEVAEGDRLRRYHSGTTSRAHHPPRMERQENALASGAILP